MQIRCYSCKMPISIGREMVHLALNIVHEEDLVYYDFRCQKCKKSNRVSKEQLLHSAPGWEFVPTAEPEPESKPETTTEKKKTSPKKPEKKKTSPKKPEKKKTSPKKPEKKKTSPKKTEQKKTSSKKPE